MRDAGPSLPDLLALARQGDAAALGLLLETFRVGLHHRAEGQLGGRVAVRADASDVIQQTFLEAHRAFAQFDGQTEAQVRAWLLTILDHNVASVVRDNTALQKRAVQRERSLDDSRDSGPRLKDVLNAPQSSPSQKAMRGEDADRLIRALGELPEDQREAVRLRHLEQWSLADIAAHLGRSEAATAGLVKRGLMALRQRLREIDTA